MTPDQLAGELAARLDGPHCDHDTSAAAVLAAGAFRYLNYATGPHSGDGLTCPVTAYAVTGALDTAVSGLGQLTGRLAGYVTREAAAGRLADDHGRDPAEVAARAASYLDAAGRHAAALSAALAAAQCDLGSLYQADVPGAGAVAA